MPNDFAIGRGHDLPHGDCDREPEPQRQFSRAVVKIVDTIGREIRGGTEKRGREREISFTIPGVIGGKGRPRFTTQRTPSGGTWGRAYTPEKTRSDEAIVRHFAHAAMKPLGDDVLHGPLELTMHVSRICPPSWSKKKQSGAHWITGKPDADNSLKLVGDAMNGIVYDDDAQISCVSFHRTYGKENSVHITVAELT